MTSFANEMESQVSISTTVAGVVNGAVHAISLRQKVPDHSRWSLIAQVAGEILADQIFSRNASFLVEVLHNCNIVGRPHQVPLTLVTLLNNSTRWNNIPCTL